MDFANLTTSGAIDQLMAFAFSKIDIANFFAVCGGIFAVAALYMKTMARLRVANIVSNIFFVLYGYLAPAFPTFVMYFALLPINFFRLYQLRDLISRVKNAAQGDLSMDWLRPYMTPRKYKKDDILFRKGDVANEMFLTVTGKFLVTELGIELPPGRLMGELGFAAPKNRRTQTIQCLESGDVLSITYETLLELYFQNPEFGYYLLSLTSERLLQNISRLEGALEDSKAKVQQLERGLPAASPR